MSGVSAAPAGGGQHSGAVRGVQGRGGQPADAQAGNGQQRPAPGRALLAPQRPLPLPQRGRGSAPDLRRPGRPRLRHRRPAAGARPHSIVCDHGRVSAARNREPRRASESTCEAEEVFSSMLDSLQAQLGLPAVEGCRGSRHAEVHGCLCRQT